MAFPFDFDRRPYNTLALPCECVIYFLNLSRINKLRFPTSIKYKKIGKDRECGSGDMLADRQTDRQTDRHTHTHTHTHTAAGEVVLQKHSDNALTAATIKNMKGIR